MFTWARRYLACGREADKSIGMHCQGQPKITAVQLEERGVGGRAPEAKTSWHAGMGQTDLTLPPWPWKALTRRALSVSQSAKLWSPDAVSIRVSPCISPHMAQLHAHAELPRLPMRPRSQRSGWYIRGSPEGVETISTAPSCTAPSYTAPDLDAANAPVCALFATLTACSCSQQRHIASSHNPAELPIPFMIFLGQHDICSTGLVCSTTVIHLGLFSCEGH